MHAFSNDILDLTTPHHHFFSLNDKLESFEYSSGIDQDIFNGPLSLTKL